MTKKVTIDRLSTGVPGLDEILGGGLPEYSFNLIGGPPGCGKRRLPTRSCVMATRGCPLRDVLVSRPEDAALQQQF